MTNSSIFSALNHDAHREPDMNTRPAGEPSGPLTHAGGVVYRVINSVTQFFLISGRRHPEHWLLPRGHIEPGERPMETAVREVREETGLEARIVGEAGTFQYEQEGRPVRIVFYVMEKTGGREEDAPEGRQWRWCTREAALAALSFADYRRCLESACRLLETGGEGRTDQG
jgi:8-oxo-dGTP pyrophosphatase MutT (NUDIX family)